MDHTQILTKPKYTEIVLAIANGKNYATSIAKFLGKTQPTVTEQLKELEKAELIKPKKRGKAKEYEIEWKKLLEIFYDFVKEITKIRKEFREFFSKEEIEKIKKIGIKNIIPEKLIKTFLKEYIISYVEIGGKRKSFDEVIISFFGAIDNLDNKYKKKLIKEFGIEHEDLFFKIASIINFELTGKEMVTFMTYFDQKEKDRKSKEKKNGS